MSELLNPEFDGCVTLSLSKGLSNYRSTGAP